MSEAAVRFGPALVGVLAVLVVTAAVVVRWGGLGRGREVVVAAVRALVQLAAVSLVITLVLRSFALTGLFILVMFTIAALTAARRAGTMRLAPWTAVAIGAGAAPVLALVWGSGAVPVAPLAWIPVAGIVIGGSMVATSQAVRRAQDELVARAGEYEAALSLGLGDRAAALEICRPSAGHALIPALDQTRTVGLVTLPGSYVGLLLGGASPVEAGLAQLLVLIALLAAEAVAIAVAVELVAAGRLGASGPIT
ncbi:ABC transporter permease [Glycomyces sp. NPDC047010]|uniref:ABC transporter permease n=1 Tax=Glycomyces sp. NPDC047010 TaxID=3155023 RepID=UPI0033D4652D